MSRVWLYIDGEVNDASLDDFQKLVDQKVLRPSESKLIPPLLVTQLWKRAIVDWKTVELENWKVASRADGLLENWDDRDVFQGYLLLKTLSDFPQRVDKANAESTIDQSA